MHQTELSLSKQDRRAVDEFRAKGLHRAREFNRAHILAAFSAHLSREIREFPSCHQLRKARCGTPNNSRTCCCRGVRSASKV